MTMSINQKIDQDIVSIVAISERYKLQPGPTQGLLAKIQDMLSCWGMKRAGRRALREMADWQLRDIGLSPADAAKEISKSRFWD
ncbi:DUF1127 domain-containing protein [Rhizobium mongolense]|uniref:Uncharacterized protein YjiS (DUF1127 family) n=2 Tax=Rhizobium mongolense TaxID=57676 RepID=A0ABR6IL29_9HYPH|nr:DUF1127 domain-containing protein [Rhizobium mongolense]MBB4228579.1 uncharacterized protein YjiS (DUF1127 family) [Rhizobium mongolense]TVZ63820.1 uncharacterized protein YjiS (DUF1127 family) [Rhizobium mongolense USDA 1844]